MSAPHYVYGVHECPGGCGMDDLDTRSFACAGCIERLPEGIRDALYDGGPDLLPVLARAKIYFENTRGRGA